MIKGICKQVYVLKGKDDDFFEQAIFTIKPSYLKKTASNTDFFVEANKIIAKKISSYAPRRKKVFGIF